MVARMREKGQVTIPAGIREALHLTKDSVLSISRIGDSVLLVPKPSVVESIAARFSRAAKEHSITLDDLLKDLKRMRHP